MIKYESRLYLPKHRFQLLRHSLSRYRSKWFNDNYLYSFSHEYIEWKHSRSNYIENETLVSTVDFRVQSAVSWERPIELIMSYVPGVISLLCRRVFFFTLATTRRNKISSAYQIDLLSSEMVAQQFSWSIRIYEVQTASSNSILNLYIIAWYAAVASLNED